MTMFDYSVVGVIGLSILIGVLRGAIKEVLSLVGWVAAFLLANAFAADLSEVLTPVIKSSGLRIVITYIALFVVTLLGTALLQIVLSELVKAIGLGGLDRALGLFIGVTRGVLIVLIAVLACGMTTLPQEPFWQGAFSAKWFEAMATSVKPWLPEEFAGRIRLPSKPTAQPDIKPAMLNVPSTCAKVFQQGASTQTVQQLVRQGDATLLEDFCASTYPYACASRLDLGPLATV